LFATCYGLKANTTRSIKCDMNSSILLPYCSFESSETSKPGGIKITSSQFDVEFSCKIILFSLDLRNRYIACKIKKIPSSTVTLALTFISFITSSRVATWKINHGESSETTGHTLKGVIEAYTWISPFLIVEFNLFCSRAADLSVFSKSSCEKFKRWETKKSQLHFYLPNLR